MAPPVCFFFGCWDSVGHFLHTEKGPGMSPTTVTPWGEESVYGAGIDGVLAPVTTPWQKEGIAKLHHKEGWTALAFWDRSIDTRYGSNGVFLINDLLTFEEAVEAFGIYFKEIATRVKASEFKRA